MTENRSSSLSELLQQGQGMSDVRIGLEGVTVRLPQPTVSLMLVLGLGSTAIMCSLALLAGLWHLLPALALVALAPVAIGLMMLFGSLLGGLRPQELLLTIDAIQISRERFLLAPPVRQRIMLDEILEVHFRPQTMGSGGDPGSAAAIVLQEAAMFGASGQTLVGVGGSEPLLQWQVTLIRIHLDQRMRQRIPGEETAEVRRALQSLLHRA